MIDKRKSKPPVFAEMLLSRFLPAYTGKDAVGDYAEVFSAIAEEKSHFRAVLWYWSQVFKDMIMFIMSKIKQRIIMLMSYMKIAFRNLIKSKGYSFINISGLSVGFACSILMLLWVFDEVRFDTFHENSNEIYRVITNNIEAGEKVSYAITPMALGPELKSNYSEIVDFTRYTEVSGGWLLQYEDKSFLNDRLGSADPAFFNIFSFDFLEGDPLTALDQPYTMVITENMARKYFGQDEALGKVIKIHGKGFEVKGVIKNIPENSHIRFDFIFPMTFWEAAWGTDLSSWEGLHFHTYIQLNDKTDKDFLESKITNILQENVGGSTSTISMQPLERIHLYSDYKSDLTNHGSIAFVYIFAFTGSGILLIACINFINLATAKAGNRAKEIGVRKVIGAKRNEIIGQVYSETMLMVILGFAGSIVLVYTFLPLFNGIVNKNLIFNYFDFRLLIGFVIIGGITVMISGSYPAFYLSSFKPVQVLKGAYSSGASTKAGLRKFLVISQFAFSIILFTASTIIVKQVDYLINKDLGFEKDNILFFLARGEFGRNFEMVRNELLSNTDILEVSRSTPPYYKGASITDVIWPGKNSEEEIIFYQPAADYYYQQTFNPEILEGRTFSRSLTTDNQNYLINETAARLIGYDSPVGRELTVEGNKGIIIGVLKDYHNQPLQNNIVPSIVKYSSSEMYICVKISKMNTERALTFLETKWDQFVPGFPFLYQFFDDELESYYKQEQYLYKVIVNFSRIAIFLSAMGLVGLASYLTEQRTKEIGVRKVLGADVRRILTLLTQDYLTWTGIALFIGLPASWIIMNSWLQNYSYSISINSGILISSTIFAVSLVFITVVFQSMRVAFLNPVRTLRHE